MNKSYILLTSLMVLFSQTVNASDSFSVKTFVNLSVSSSGNSFAIAKGSSGSGQIPQLFLYAIRPNPKVASSAGVAGIITVNNTPATNW